MDNVSDCRCVSDCISRGRELDPGPVLYFRELISTVILLHFLDSRRVVVSYKRRYVHEVLVNRLVKLAKEKVWLVELTFPTISTKVWDRAGIELPTPGSAVRHAFVVRYVTDSSEPRLLEYMKQGCIDRTLDLLTLRYDFKGDFCA